MSTRHTPGPWNAFSGGQAERLDVGSDPTGQYVCKVDRESDALLISAAPEMYEALREVQKLITQIIPAARFMGQRREDKFAQIEKMADRVEEAIAKAEGRHS